ncbi:hypothetical protein Moror_11098 [Moniliophthora roreri MCA 2997]|uniref:Integral membrane protein n=2 Tax=Moniliophthora roreri TaxID=221103 RepID=V2WAF6_MONRO|nr:hypothetical protein Moror_11098 [Moniliophthora roreri MCA 2997]KAI3601177.1 hypothetical protein WG66_001638 [Moniliophthora roreri]
MADTSSQALTLIVATAVQFFLYGVYTVLSGISTHILLKRKRRWYRYDLVAVILLFLLASTCIALDVADDIKNFRQGSASSIRVISSARLEPIIVSSAIADAILLWRCYAVWGKRWKIVIAPILFYVGSHTSAFALVAVRDTEIVGTVTAAGAVALNNLLLSMLIAFRIFTMSREASAFLGPRARDMYRTAIVATLESGIIYSAFLGVIVSLGIDLLRHSDRDDLYGRNQAIITCLRSWASIAGIASTIIIVRVALGISLNDVDGTIRSLRVPATPVHEQISSC